MQSFYASHIFDTIGLGLTKCSVGLFLLRITPVESHRRILYGTLGFTALWTVASTFAVALQCDVSDPWIVLGKSCSGAVRVLVHDSEFRWLT